MASKNKAGNSRSSSAGSRKDKHGSNKNGKKGDGPSGSSFFTWFMIIALLGVWSSVAVVWFDLVDYEDVLGKLGIYDADGDGDFDVEDAKILLGLTKGDGSNEQIGTLEEVLDIITEESSDWVYGFLSFLYDVMTPFEILEEENEASEDVAEPGGKMKAKAKSKEKGLKEVEGPIPAERFGKSEEPVHVAVHPPIETETGTEEPEPIEAAVAQESFKTNIEEPAEEEPEPEPAEEEPEPAEEETNEFDAGADDSDGPEAAEVEYEAESDYEEADIREESVYVEDEAVSEREEIVGDSEPEVVGVPEDSFPESEVREEEVDDYTTSDEAVLKPEEVVSEQDIPVYESETEDFSDQMDGEGEIEEDMPISDEFIEDNDPELEDKMDEFYAEEMEYDPGTDDIQEALPVQKRDEDDLSANTSQNLDVESEIQVAVPLPEAVEEPMEKEDDTLEATKEHPAEEEHVNYTEDYTEDYPEVSEPLESEPSESDHLEITGEPQEEEVIAEPEISPSKDKLKEMSSDKRSDSEVKKEEKVPAKKKKPKLLNKFDKTIKPELDAAEKLRKKGKSEEALQAFTELLRRYPQSPRAKYGKAQSEDDLAEKMRSNEILQRAITTYGEVVDLPNPTADLVKLALKRQANRQQFLGHIKRSVVTLKKLVSLYPDDISTRNELGVSYLLLGDNSNAKKVYEEVLAMAPNDGFAKVHYGFILKAANQIAESIPYLKEGLLSGDPGTDDGRFYFHLGDALQRVGDQEAYTWYELGHKRGHFASVWQRSLYNVNGLKAQPWWTAKETGYTELVKTLEKNWKLIREEGLNVMDKESGFFLPEDENLREKGDWGQFTIWQQGRRIENSCKQVPKTCALLERFPETTGCKRGQIKYSVMQPGTHVWPHTGPTNCRLRMHLGLVIPKQGCRIRCANDTREWKEGKVLIFDDSFEHEVWQDAVSYRLIFIVDVWHPELTAHQRRTLSPI